MQDCPTAAELTETVAAFLLEEIRPEIKDPRLRFRLLIAANVLTIAARELDEGEGPLLAEWERLRDLLVKEDQTPPARAEALQQETMAWSKSLCQRIRAGAYDHGEAWDRAFEHSYQTVVDKSRINNPRYLAKNG